MGTIFRRIRDTQRRAVYAINGEAAPCVLPRAGVAPFRGTQFEDALEWCGPQSLSCFDDRAGRHRGLRPRQRQTEFSDEIVDRKLPEQGHANHQPDDLLGWKTTTSHGRSPRGFQRRRDPLWINVLANVLELLGRSERAYGVEGLLELHGRLQKHRQDAGTRR